MSIQTINIASKNRRRRRRKNNKNKNKPQINKPQINKPQINKQHLNKSSNKQTVTQKTTLYSTTNKNPWAKTNVTSKLTNIMNQQSNKQSNQYIGDNYTLPINDTNLLEQQMILEAIAESNKLQKQIEEKQIDEKQPDIIDEKQIIISAIKTLTDNSDIQTINDEILAIHLQKQESKQLLRQQKLNERYNGKFAKVTSSSAHAAIVDKSALQFYYDDDMKQYTQKPLSEEQIIRNENENNENNKEDIDDNNDEMIAISKHDAKIWSETHMNRLNEYETGGNLNTTMNIGNQCYNSFRNKLDKKGFITYNNYQLQPKDKKR